MKSVSLATDATYPESVKTVGILPKSINTRVKNLKTMFRFLHEDGVIDSDPFATLKPVDDVGRDIGVLTVDELKRLLDAPDKRKYSDLRDYVVLNLLIDGMFRIDEALTLHKTRRKPSLRTRGSTEGNRQNAQRAYRPDNEKDRQTDAGVVKGK